MSHKFQALIRVFLILALFAPGIGRSATDDSRFGDQDAATERRDPDRQRMRAMCGYILEGLDASDLTGNKNMGAVNPDVEATFNAIWVNAVRGKVSGQQLFERYIQYLHNQNPANRNRVADGLRMIVLRDVRDFLHVMHNPDEVIDLTQEIYVNLINLLEKRAYNGPESFGSVMQHFAFLLMNNQYLTLTYVLNQYISPVTEGKLSREWKDLVALKNILADPLYSIPRDERDDFYVSAMDNEVSDSEVAMTLAADLKSNQNQSAMDSAKVVEKIVLTKFPLIVDGKESRTNAIFQAVFYRRIFTTSPDTQYDVGHDFGLTNTRIGQYESKLIRKIRKLLGIKYVWPIEESF